MVTEHWGCGRIDLLGSVPLVHKKKILCTFVLTLLNKGHILLKPYVCFHFRLVKMITENETTEDLLQQHPHTITKIFQTRKPISCED